MLSNRKSPDLATFLGCKMFHPGSSYFQGVVSNQSGATRKSYNINITCILPSEREKDAWFCNYVFM